MRKNSVSKRIRIGDRFGLYVVASPPEIKQLGAHRAAVCECVCDCGNRRQVHCGNLLRREKPGRHGSQSCGCLKVTVGHTINRKHCFSGTRIYTIWAGMIKRCENPKVIHFADYGGRGITVCPEWRSSFEAFFDWAMANGYTHELTLDRKENDLGYSPENCRWADWVTQQNNRRNTRIVEAFGDRKSLMNWSRDPRCKVDYQCLFKRFQAGVPMETALTAPLKTWKRRAASLAG